MSTQTKPSSDVILKSTFTLESAFIEITGNEKKY